MNFSSLFNSKTLRTGSIGSVVIKLLGTGFTFGISILLARLLGLENYGTYVLILSTIMLLSIPLTFGLPLLLTRFIPKYEVNNDKAAIKGLLIRANQFILLTYLVIILLALLYYFFFGKGYSEEIVYTCVWGLILLPIMGYNSIRAAALQGMRYIILGQIPDTLLRVMFLFLGILGYHFLIEPITAPMAMAIHAGSALLSYIIGFYFLKKKLLNTLRGIQPIYHTKDWLSKSFQFSLNMGINNIKTRISTYILAIFSGTAAVALFEVAFKGASLVSFALTALNTAIAPHISKTYEEGDRKKLQRIIKKASRAIFAFSIPASFVFIFGGWYIIDVLYGAEYEGSYWPLVILCIGQLVNAFAGSVGLLLNMTGNQKYVLKVNLINTLANIIISILLVQWYGVIGAAVAFTLLLLIQNFIFVWYAQKKLQINTTVL